MVWNWNKLQDLSINRDLSLLSRDGSGEWGNCIVLFSLKKSLFKHSQFKQKICI